MDCSYEGSKLSMEKRRDIVYELAKSPDNAIEVLQTWSRQEILLILCTEMGKERKYTGLTKLKIIEHLLKVISEKTSDDNESVVSEPPHFSPSVSQKRSKRSRKPENFSRLLVSSSTTNLSACITSNDSGIARYCENVACKARLKNEDVFCKRCTCCICHKYDDNKDPSLWLMCSSEPPFPGDSCNMSCHLECALIHGRSGILRNMVVDKLDGSFYCVSCGKMNDLMRCWRKQLTIAKETRRVDILCYRISLSQKLLSGTKKHQELSKFVDNAVRLLESEVGALDGGRIKMGRGIVNRLSSGQQVQKLCSSAIDSFDLITHHASSNQGNSSNEPPSSTNTSQDQNVSFGSAEDQIGSNDLYKSTELPKTSLPVTPAGKESLKSVRKGEEEEKEDGVRNLEYYVKVIRRLECEGHIEESFRQKFLTWYSIRATPPETRIVKAFVDTLRDDPACLSEQLVDTFGELVSCKRSSDVPHGFCFKLWH